MSCASMGRGPDVIDSVQRNLDSMRAAAASSPVVTARRISVLGEMLELEDSQSLHQQVVRLRRLRGA